MSGVPASSRVTMQAPHALKVLARKLLSLIW